MGSRSRVVREDEDIISIIKALKEIYGKETLKEYLKKMAKDLKRNERPLWKLSWRRII